MKSNIQYTKFISKFNTFSEERVYKSFLLNNLFADAFDDENEDLYLGSTYLYLYIVVVDNLVDKKNNESFNNFFNSFDYLNKSWLHFSNYCDKNEFKNYWNKFITLSINGCKKRFNHNKISVSELWEMSSFISLIPIALSIKHNKQSKIHLWVDFILNLFNAIQIMDDIYDMLEDIKDNVFNIFEFKLKQYESNYISQFYNIEKELKVIAKNYLNNAINIAKLLSADKLISHCLNLESQITII